MKEELDLLEQPLSADEMTSIIASGDPYVERNVLVPFDVVLNNDFEYFLDCLSEKMTGTSLLIDIGYEIADVADENTLIIKVRGDVSNCVEE